MKTDQLINLLSTNVEPVKSGQVRKTLAFAIIAGGGAAFCVMLGTVGVRADLADASHLFVVALKLVFPITLIALGALLLSKLVRPGQEGRKLFRLLLLPFLVVAIAAAVALVSETPMVWGRMIFGMNWAMCLLCIPLFAVVPFVALIWFLRKGAPTELRRTGAIAGLVAGALGATAYAFHCPDDSIPFIAIWYGAMVALCGFVGSLLGPKLLRW